MEVTSDNEEKINLLLTPDSKNTSIPILKCENVKSVNNLYYALRITPAENIGSGDVLELLELLSGDIWICATEKSSSGVLHYHTIFLSERDQRDEIRIWLEEYVPKPWTKATGNKLYNLKACEDTDQAIKYCLKDKDYKFGNGILKTAMDEMAKKSYKKYSKADFQIQFEKLKLDYHEEKITSKMLKASIIRLKGSFGQPINIARIDDIVLGCVIRRNPELAEDY